MTIPLPPNNPPPRHYAPGRFGIECIQITRLMTFTAGNAVKYIWRYTDKGGTDDLRKAIDYLGWTIPDLSRGGSVWNGPDERVAGRLMVDQWIRPRLTESDTQWAIVEIAVGGEADMAKALERISAAIGVRP